MNILFGLSVLQDRYIDPVFPSNTSSEYIFNKLILIEALPVMAFKLFQNQSKKLFRLWFYFSTKKII